jgi:RNA polymerase sigma-70 factor (ECF subfamily)
MDVTDGDRWKRLMTLLEPIHGQGLATARRLCRSAADGDDLYQEAVLRAFEKLHTVRDHARFHSWFYAILLSRHRSRMRRPFWKGLVPWESAFATDSGPVGEDARDREGLENQAARAARALESLAPEQREAVVLFEVDGYSIEEIAGMQRTSVSAVKSRLTRGRDRLRRWYRARGFGERHHDD